MGSTLGVKYDLILAPYAVRFLNICVKEFTDMPWSSCNRAVKKTSDKKKALFLRKRPTIFDLFEGLWSVDTFLQLASV